jgi:E3 ubiquitin-protein ligase TRIP12
MVDPQLHSSLQTLKNLLQQGDASAVESLMLEFTLPGYPDIELLPSGADIPVTLSNLSKYIDLVVDITVGSGISFQIGKFREGFNRFIPIDCFACFSSIEILRIFGGEEDQNWVQTGILYC